MAGEYIASATTGTCQLFIPTFPSKVVNTKSRLVSGLARNPLVISFHPRGNLYIQIFKPCNIIKVSEPTYFVTYDIGFKRETYFDGAFGVLKKVKVLLKKWRL